MTVKELLIQKGYDAKKAEALVMAGQVLYKSNKVFSLSEKVEDASRLEVRETKKYVSRGAYKLLEAIKDFDLDFNNKTIIDIGSSTGGFTQVSLEAGAKKVYSLDSGTNQLDYKLRSDDRVVALEKTNLKTITLEQFSDVEFVVCDVSFISLKHVFEVMAPFKEIKMMLLIKPQFEANSDQVQEGGYVPQELHEEIINKVKNYGQEFNFKMTNIKESPIKGGVSKNIEYISMWERG